MDEEYGLHEAQQKGVEVLAGKPEEFDGIHHVVLRYY